MQIEADIVIVGGGSAGCALALRLSADPSLRVVLLEAGRGDRHPLHAFPMLTGHYFKRPQDNWSYSTEPQRELNHRKIFWPRGKRLGGSSIFNGMVYARGNAGDYDHWASLGNRGWSYEEVLPYFKRNETFEDGEDELHGGSGMLCVSHARVSNPLFKAFVAAGQEAGYPLVRDMNGPNPSGVGFYDFHMLRGRRSNSAGALLRVAGSRPNLRIVDNATVKKIVFDGKRATGVDFSRGGVGAHVSARREVVLCAGAVGTPQILLLSGLGPSAHVEELGIAPIVDLPGVGENLIDHLDAFVRTLSTRPVSILRELRADRIARHVAQAMMFGTGPVSQSPISAGGYFFSREGLQFPDLQAFFVPVLESGAAVWWPGTARAKEVSGQHAYSLRIGPIRPASRGRIRLRSGSAFDAPLIDPGYLSAPSDLSAMVAGIRIARRILEQPAFAPYRDRELTPGPDMRSDAEIESFIRQSAGTVYHPVGTARMGADPLAVVDERLRVWGVDGLRVADASVMPTIPSGNTNAPTLMVAEKAADMIAADLRQIA